MPGDDRSVGAQREASEQPAPMKSENEIVVWTCLKALLFLGALSFFIWKWGYEPLLPFGMVALSLGVLVLVGSLGERALQKCADLHSWALKLKRRRFPEAVGVLPLSRSTRREIPTVVRLIVASTTKAGRKSSLHPGYNPSQAA